MIRSSLFPLALAVVVAAQTAVGAERDHAPLTAALEDAVAPSPPNVASKTDQPGLASAPAPAPAPARGNPLWSIPLRTLSATRERPLFSPSRRPPIPVVASAPEPAPPAPSSVAKPEAPDAPPLILVGTVVSAQRRVAILFNRTTEKVTQVREGDEESGWRVRLVSRRSAVMEKDERSVTLDLPNPSDDPAAGGLPLQAPPPDAPPAVNGGVL